MGHDIFISYSRKDSQIVEQFVNEITDAGYTTWIDKEGILSGEQFKAKIVHAIKNSSIILFFSSTNANASEWTVKEISYALKKNKTIIPIQLDNSEYDDSIDFDLINIDYIKYDTECFEKTAKRIISSIETHLGPRTTTVDSNHEQNETLDPERVYMLGKTYYANNNFNQAIIYYKLAAEQGCVEAQIDLGDCYYNGDGILQNYKKAVKWYTQAAMQGNDEAQNNLGNCYYYGNGVNQNYNEAVKWFKLAADQGNGDAQNNLGNCFYEGNGVEQNYSKAIEWFKLAAEQGNDDAQNNLGRCYYYGHGVDQDYTEAVEWFKLAAEQGNVYAQNNLGHCYEYGKGVEKSAGKAYDWYSKDPENQEDIIKTVVKLILYLFVFILGVYNIIRLIAFFLELMNNRSIY